MMSAEISPSTSAAPRFGHGRVLSAMAVSILLLASGCSPPRAPLSETQRTIIEFQMNTVAWHEIPDDDWFLLAQEACRLRGWEREQAIAIAQRFVDAHPEAYERQPSDEVAALVFLYTTLLCRDRIPRDAVPPGAVDIEPGSP